MSKKKKSELEALRKAHEEQRKKDRERIEHSKKIFPNGVFFKGSPSTERKTCLTVKQIIEIFNKNNPDKIQPNNIDVLSLVNELAGIRMQTAWIDAEIITDIKKYSDDFNKLPDLSTRTIKYLEIDFGTSIAKIDSELLLAQIQEILKANLKRKFPKTKPEATGPGHKKSEWLRTCIQGKAIIENLYRLKVTNDFLAFFFNQEPETFKKKIRTVFQKTV